MKKPRRSRHNPVPPSWYTPKPVEISERYQREIDRSTERLERRYRQAEKRAADARRKLDRATAAAGTRHKERQLAQLRAELEIREAELEEIRRLMNHPTAGRKVRHRTGREERLESGVR